MKSRLTELLVLPPHAQPGPDASILASKSVNWEVLALTRFFLAWVVLSVHTFMPSRIADAFAMFGGKAAVVGFMLISGFSIAASIEARPRDFILRRILRIYPMYFGALLLTLLVQGLLGPSVEIGGGVVHASGWGRILGNLLLTQMYLCKTMEFNGPFWSLSIEFSYYLMAPLFLLLPRRVLYLLIIVSGVVFTLPTNPDAGHLYDLLTRFNGLRYIWSWVLGFCLYFNRSRALSILGLIFCLIVFPLSDKDYSGYATLVTIVLTYAVLEFSHMVRVNRLCEKSFTFLGDLSYPLYLVHFPLAILLVAGLQVESDLLFFAVSLAIAYLNILLFDSYLKTIFFKPFVTRLYRAEIWKRLIRKVSGPGDG
jgi:peptidoglycan/LPS O-acetylase OafA/YrhL